MRTTASIIFYDASCGICTAGVRRWGPMLARRGMEMCPLQEPGVSERLGLRAGEIPEEMKLLTPEGSILGGIDAFIFIARRVWWAWPVYLFSLIPGARWFLRRIYRRVAERRHALSRTCDLK